MIIDESHENYESSKLFYDVMGIGLAIWGSIGDCELFQEIDRALDAADEIQLRIIEQAFAAIPQNVQERIMSGEGNATALRNAIAQFEAEYQRRRDAHARRLA